MAYIPDQQTMERTRVQPMQPEWLVVRRNTRDTHNTVTLQLARPGDDVPYSFAPGQFNMLYVFGVGEVPISMSGDPDKPDTVIHTIREVGAVSRALSKLRRGDLVGVRGPYGSSWPLEEADGDDIVIIAGGIGLAPLRPLIYAVLAGRKRYGNVVLLYGARSPGDLLFMRELRTWRSRFDMEVQVTVDSAGEDWQGNIGVVPRLISRAQFDRDDCRVFICGPEIMMRYTALELLRAGVAADRISISMERNMKCAIGLCGHCQLGPTFVCRDGPVFNYQQMRKYLTLREI